MVMFMIALVAFYAIISTKDSGDPVEQEAERIAGNLMAHDFFQDGVLDPDELDNISTWNCTYMKQVFGTTKSVCIYMKDEEGDLRVFDVGRYFQGCEDIQIGDEVCAEP